MARFRDSDDPTEPLTPAEVDAIRSTFRFYDRDSLIPRLVATIDQQGEARGVDGGDL